MLEHGPETGVTESRMGKKTRLAKAGGKGRNLLGLPGSGMLTGGLEQIYKPGYLVALRIRICHTRGMSRQAANSGNTCMGHRASTSQEADTVAQAAL